MNFDNANFSDKPLKELKNSDQDFVRTLMQCGVAIS
jgi:hypothetical protein